MIVNGWTITKEFYADGPSLFVWTAVKGDDYEEFPRRKDAVAFAKGGKYGDCYEMAMQVALLVPDDERHRYRVVHGYPTGQGKIEGLVHGHAWVERTDDPPHIPSDLPPDVAAHFEQMWELSPETLITVIDRSNGKDIEWSRTMYYGIGNIDPGRCTYYEVDEARRLVLDHGHWGPWEKVEA